MDFLDFKDGKLKKIMVYFKHARGLMARYCAKNNVQTIDELKLFNEENYTFDEKLSTDKKLVFIDNSSKHNITLKTVQLKS